MLAVYDTSVWISGELGRGASYHCLVANRRGEVQLAYCKEMAHELALKLYERLNWSPHDVYAVAYHLRSRCKRIDITGTLRVCRDPDDDMFIECAVLAGATWVVSLDKHLLELKEYEGIRFVTPKEFLNILRNPLKDEK